MRCELKRFADLEIIGGELRLLEVAVGVGFGVADSETREWSVETVGVGRAECDGYGVRVGSSGIHSWFPARLCSV